MQSSEYAKQLKRQTALNSGDEEVSDDDENNDHSDGQAEELTGLRENTGGDGDDLSVNSMGDIAWDHLVDKIKASPEAHSSLLKSSLGVAVPFYKCRRTSCKMLPFSIAMFILLPLLLAPFYVVVYVTSVTAVKNVLEAQVNISIMMCASILCMPVLAFLHQRAIFHWVSCSPFFGLPRIARA